MKVADTDFVTITFRDKRFAGGTLTPEEKADIIKTMITENVFAIDPAMADLNVSVQPSADDGIRNVYAFG